MSNPACVLVVKKTASIGLLEELGDVLSENNVLIKLMDDYMFDSMFDINTENVDVNIEDDTFLAIAKMAHEENITFNQKITSILAEQMEREKKGV